MVSLDIVSKTAAARHALHEGHASSRPLSHDYENVGLQGELAFGQAVGQLPDLSEKPKGDGGVDFTVWLRLTVDVKTARKPGHLIHEQGKPFADLYVLADYDDSTKQSKLLGWEWGRVLAGAPVKDFGYGIVSHHLPANALKPITKLIEKIVKFS